MNDNSRGSQAEMGIWCQAYVRENAPPESNVIQVGKNA